ncbi:MAG: IS21 family transposase [Cyanobacteria bacterium]|nr:IS21 family transposase [Cyanobacteriota bacterium]
MTCTPEQIERLIQYRKTMSLAAAAAKAHMSVRTARDYLKRGGRMKHKKCREYRTRVDPFDDVWSEVRGLLEADCGYEAKTILEWLDQRYPDRFTSAQLRTLQRRIRDWRVLEGPERKEVVFPQNILPGKQSQSDYTHCNELNVLIAGQPFPHMVFHFMLPYSRWEYVELANAESYETLTGGYTRAVESLGAVAKDHRTDNLAAAVPIGKRGEFQESWKRFLEYYGVEPSANNPGCSNENGSVEKSHDLFKKALHQRLLLRGSRDFGSVDAYERYLKQMVAARNKSRREKVTEELKHLKPLPHELLKELKELTLTVSGWSTVVIQRSVYSVPSRFIGIKLRAIVSADTIELYYGTKKVATMAKVAPGSKSINYRHVISHLLRKPGAFANYQFREELFPSSVFRKAFDELTTYGPGAEKEYLRILNLAAHGSELDVTAALNIIIETAVPVSESRIRELIERKFPVPSVNVIQSSLAAYDQLLSFKKEEPAISNDHN